MKKTRLYTSFFCVLFVGLTSAFNNLTSSIFEETLSPLFGDSNLVRSPDDRSVRLLLDRYTGSGFISSNMYQHGFFSAMVKLPADYPAGVVVAFYTSNGDVFEKTHDELDFEFLGNIKGKPWRFQTNLYGNGSTWRGREERYRLWFDPSKEFHRYSILWTSHKIIFWVDDVPIREVVRSEAMGGEYPQKPMALYATIWDASDWATSGGKFKANYKYAPFVADFKSFSLHGCAVDPIQQLPGSDSDPDCADSDDLLRSSDFSTITPHQRSAMRRFRQHYMYYSYCYDSVRYPEPLPECVIDPAERDRFRETGRLTSRGGR
ncbi:PREDICTED: probable xyloglucan endotransglucosylase/hydrolase protein 30 [Tarenaya hassleriana]|uniref:probable xyloglucan endotransglucosylase/hydrolase protein 30 n=1 Tax=Tarenaya hassleriana TaxID=28532 RepID=UPI00053CA939|nr:PREDICTED: probable xyloglucan endotransglucosylase/hydrolase protein 30 [Tarenaya hassleriana]